MQTPSPTVTSTIEDPTTDETNGVALARRAHVLRSWAAEAPLPLAVAMRRRACELDLLAAVGAPLVRAA